MNLLMCIVIFKGLMVKTQQTCHIIRDSSDKKSLPPSELVSASWHHRSLKSHIWNAEAELFDAIRVLGQAIST